MAERSNRTAIAVSLSLLARREHFESELRVKLAAREFTMAEIDAAINEAKELGWQSEERATESYVRMRIGKGYGPLKIRAELMQRGVCDSLIGAHLPDDVGYWMDRLGELCLRRFGDCAVHEIDSREVRFLLRRGFTTAMIMAKCDKKQMDA